MRGLYNHQLDAFVAAAELGSFTRAAEAMFISAPALIQQINLLEGRCGARLFARGSRGVTLTPAGRSLYEDAKTIIRLSGDAVEKARRIAAGGGSTVRIGTSLLFKCRLFPDLWSRASALCPELRAEILPLPGRERQGRLFAGLGTDYDLVEGVYGSTAYEGLCGFLELMRTPICCAVARGHRLAGAERLSLADLAGESLVLPVAGVSRELDELRREAAALSPAARIVDSAYYGVDTFALCELEPYVLITQQVYADIHPQLVTIPLDSGRTMPYGLMYAKTPSPAARRFLDAVSASSG